MKRKVLLPALAWGLLLCFARGGAGEDVVVCEGMDGEYAIPARVDCSSLNTPEEAAEKTLAAYRQIGYDQEAIRERVRHECDPTEEDLEKKKMMAEEQGYEWHPEIYGVHQWACVRGWTVRNTCGGYLIEGEVEGHKLQAGPEHLFHMPMGAAKKWGFIVLITGEGKTWQNKAAEILRSLLAHSEQWKSEYCDALYEKLGWDPREKPVSGDEVLFFETSPPKEAVLTPGVERPFTALVEYSLLSSGRPGRVRLTAEAVLLDGRSVDLFVLEGAASPGERQSLKFSSKFTPLENAARLGFKAELFSGGELKASDEFICFVEQPLRVQVIPLGHPMPASGKGRFPVKLKFTQAGKPLANLRFYLRPPSEPDPSFSSFGSYPMSEVMATDEQGMAEFYYTPAKLDPKKHARLSTEEAERGFQEKLVIEVLDPPKELTVAIPLSPPHPRIRSFRVPEASAGDWQKAASVVEVEDPDSESFTYRVVFQGELGWKGGFNYQTVMEAQAGPAFEFRLKAPPFGMDLQNLPELWSSLSKATARALLENALSQSGEFLASRKIISELSKEAIDGANKAKDIYSLYQDAQSALSAGEKAKNLADQTGVAVKAINITVGAVDFFAKKGAPLPLKLAYENAKAFYDVFEAHRKVAEAYEDIIFLPVALEVEDEDGYKDFALRKVAVRFYRR